MKPFFQNEPRLLAHRGMPQEFPENTLISFQNAVEFGVDVIETDTHLTKEKEFIIAHDADISRISDGKGLISDFKLQELKEFDAGYKFTIDGGKKFPFRDKGIRFMSVSEILDAFPTQKFNIDLKDNEPSQVKLWVNLIKEKDAIERVLTASQYTNNLALVRKAFPTMTTSFSAKEVFTFYCRNKFGGLKNLKRKIFQGDALQVPIQMAGMRIITEKSIRNAHALGFKIHVWTINDKPTMERLFKMGVDAIFTDYPRILKEVILERF